MGTGRRKALEAKEAEGLRDSRQGPCVLKIQHERQGGSLFEDVEEQCGWCSNEGEIRDVE